MLLKPKISLRKINKLFAQAEYDLQVLRDVRNEMIRADRAKGMIYQDICNKYNISYMQAHRIVGEK